MINGEGDRVVDWVWSLCNISFVSGVEPEDEVCCYCSTEQG